MATDEAPTQRPAGRSLTADQIKQQTFSRVRKGLDEREVSEFLRRVAGEHEALSRRVAELEERLRHPSVPTEQQLVDLVGDEVARTLRSAQVSADEVTNRARARASQIQHQAAEDAQRLRAEQLEQSTQDARAIVEAARERGREMVAEARLLRERVITDLNHRRDLLRAYIEQLRAERDRFASTYRAVRQTVSDAHDELLRFESERPFQPVPVEAGPAATPPSESARKEPPPVREPKPTETSAATGIGLGELPGQTEPVPPLAPRSRKPEPKTKTEPKAAPKTEPKTEAKAAPKAQPKTEPKPAPKTEPKPEPKPEPEPAPGPAFELAPELEAEPALDLEPKPELDLDGEPALHFEPEPATKAPEAERGADVEALFQRIKAGRDQEASTVVEDGRKQRAQSPQPGAAGTITEPEGAVENDAELLTNRDDALTPLAEDLLRRCKRVLQDEQNEVLDALRRHRGRLTADKLLPPADEQLARWAEVMSPAIDQAYVAARASASSSLPGSPLFSAPRRVVTGLVEVVITPLRERLLSAVQQTLADDPKANADAIAHRIGARYREWKGQELDGRIGDVLAAAYARGIYDAAPDGSRLRWVPAEPGQCPDAEDNALEPTPRGERFPTGQPFPPAHPGCRCLLAVMQER